MLGKKFWQDFFRHSSVCGWYLDEGQGVLILLCDGEEKDRICAQLRDLWDEEVCWFQSYRLCIEELEIHKRFRELQEKRREVELYRRSFFWESVVENCDISMEKKVWKREGEFYNQKYLSQIVAAVKLLKKE